MNEIKGNKEVDSFNKEKRNERALCDSHTKLSGQFPLENWRICVADHRWKKECAIHLEEKDCVSDNLRHLRKSKINTSGIVPQRQQNQMKDKRGSKSSKLIEAARSSKVSLSENIPIKQIKESTQGTEGF